MCHNSEEESHESSPFSNSHCYSSESLSVAPSDIPGLPNSQRRRRWIFSKYICIDATITFLRTAHILATTPESTWSSAEAMLSALKRRKLHHVHILVAVPNNIWSGANPMFSAWKRQASRPRKGKSKNNSQTEGRDNGGHVGTETETAS